MEWFLFVLVFVLQEKQTLLLSSLPIASMNVEWKLQGLSYTS